jgi:multidrug resistance efflux pump
MMETQREKPAPKNGFDAPPAGPPKGGAGKRLADRLRGNPRMLVAAVAVGLLAMTGGMLYVYTLQTRVYIEKSEVSAPVIVLTTNLSAQSPGTLERVYVRPGDRIHRNNVVARVSGRDIRAKVDGIVIDTKDTIGQLVSSQDAIVEMIDPREFRVVGHIDEDKGLSDIRVGQRVVFTVDAFGSREYPGTVDSVSPSARQGDIVFSISDKRQIREYDVKAAFDQNAYPEIKNGMSAKMWVYK